MNSLPDLIYPIIWIATPIWLLFLFWALRKKQSHASVWGFLLPIQEGAPKDSNLSWPWKYLLCLSILGSLIFYIVSIPHEEKLQIYVDEPDLLSLMDHSQKIELESKLELSPESKLHIKSPKGDLVLRADHFKELFNHKFVNNIHETWYNPNRESEEDFSIFPDFEYLFKAKNSSKLNTSGFYGLRSDKNKLYLAIWTQDQKNYELEFGSQRLQLPKRPWQYIEVPNEALGKTITLNPLDEFRTDNHISLKGLHLQHLNWSSTQDVSTNYQSILNQQKLWVEHEKLFITFNQTSSEQKSINFINQAIPNFSEAIAADTYKNLYSTAYLTQSSRHHSLEWPLAEQPLFSLSLTEKTKPLWFHANHNFTIQRGPSIHTSLNASTFKQNLNESSFKLMLKNLYPNLDKPWLIQRGPSFKINQTTLTDSKPISYFNLSMALCLLLTSLLGCGLSLIRK